MMRKHRRVEVLFTALGLILLAGACHKKKVVAPPPPPPPPPPPAAPVCNVSAEPTTVEKGQSATLTWSSQNATDLDLEPSVGKVQTSGSQSVTPDDSTTYTLTATGAGGNTSCTARVTVTAPPPPPPPPPPAPTGPSEQDLFNQNMKTAYFDFDKSDIRPDAQQALQSDADFLKQHPDIKFTFEGNCDERGSEEYNLGLGQRRADAAKKFLTDNGISGDNITTISYGKDRPVCTDHNEECWQKNRSAKPAYGTESQPSPPSQ